MFCFAKIVVAITIEKIFPEYNHVRQQARENDHGRRDPDRFSRRHRLGKQKSLERRRDGQPQRQRHELRQVHRRNGCQHCAQGLFGETKDSSRLNGQHCDDDRWRCTQRRGFHRQQLPCEIFVWRWRRFGRENSARQSTRGF